MKKHLIIFVLLTFACAGQQPPTNIEPRPSDEFLWLDETTGRVYTNEQLVKIVNDNLCDELKKLLKDAAAVIDNMREPNEQTRSELLERIDKMFVKLKEREKR
jgi:hypothetical protein